MMKQVLKTIRWTLRFWFYASFVAFLAGLVIWFVGAPRWLPLPWGSTGDFVQSADGKVFVTTDLYNRVLCYGQNGQFIASYPYPSPPSRWSRRLAASNDGRIFLKTGRLVTIHNSEWNKQATIYNGNNRETKDFMLDNTGTPVPASLAGVPVVDRLARPGDKIFAEFSRRKRFECNGGSTLIRRGNQVRRISPDGELLCTYAPLIIFRPLTFPWPALLAWAYFWIDLFISDKPYARRRRPKRPQSRKP